MLQQTTAATVAGAFRRRFSRAFRASRRSRRPTRARSCMPGRGSATTAARAPCTPAPESWSSSATAGCRTARARCAQLPGIGAYTARAILAIAFDQAVVPVDANVARVLVRLHGIEAPLPAARQRRCTSGPQRWPRTQPRRRRRPGADGSRRHGLPARPAASAGQCPWRSACVATPPGSPSGCRAGPRRPARPTRRGLAFLLTRAGRRDAVPPAAARTACSAACTSCPPAPGWTVALRARGGARPCAGAGRVAAAPATR